MTDDELRSRCLTALERLIELQVAASSGGDPEIVRGQMAEAIFALRGAGEEMLDLQLGLCAAADEFSQVPGSHCDWTTGPRPQQPLQTQFFGTDVAGEQFFARLKHYLESKKQGRERVVLEVYAVCLNLGFVGKFGAHNLEGIESLRDEVTAQLLPSSLALGGPNMSAHQRRRNEFTWVLVAAGSFLFVASMWVSLRYQMASTVATYLDYVERSGDVEENP